MTLLKTSFLNAIAVLIRMITMLGINKVLAVYVGPAGYAALGQFQNAIQMLVTFSGGAFNTGVVKYTAEFGDSQQEQHVVWRTAAMLSLIVGGIVALCIAIFAKQLSLVFLPTESMHSVFYWLSASLVFFIFNGLLLAVLNGKKEIKKYVVANIAGSLLSVFVTTMMVVQFGLYGALVAVSIHQSITFFVTVFLVYRANWFRLSFFFGKLNLVMTKKLTNYVLMALTSAICIPLSQIFVRSHLVSAFGWEAAGYWEAMWRLSSAYLMFITATLSVYYLPKLSELKTLTEIKSEVLNGYKIIVPAAVLSSLGIFFFREEIIELLFTSDFMAMKELFGWQLAGDTLKIGSWVLAYLMLGKAMTKLFIFSEVVSALSFCMLTVFLSDYFGLQSAVIAHAINYFVYWVLMALLVTAELRKREIT